MRTEKTGKKYYYAHRRWKGGGNWRWQVSFSRCRSFRGWKNLFGEREDEDKHPKMTFRKKKAERERNFLGGRKKNERKPRGPGKTGQHQERYQSG